MSIKDIVHGLVTESPGGIKSLAARMDTPYSTLKSKLNPHCDTHHLYAVDLERIGDLLDSDAIARYFCSLRDGVFVKSHQLDGVSDMELLDLFLEREERYGKFAKRVREALSDGEIDAREFADLMRLFDEVSESREQIKVRLTHLHEQSVERRDRLKLKSIK